MVETKKVVELLSQFNNLILTKKQWDIIFKGCGMPKSVYLWIALRHYSLEKIGFNYKLKPINEETIKAIYNMYSSLNKSAVAKHYKKQKQIAKIKAYKASFKGLIFYNIGGVLTTIKPERDE